MDKPVPVAAFDPHSGRLPDPRRDSYGPGYMSAEEMDSRMRALVAQFDSVPEEMAVCPHCGVRAVAFGALWWDEAWHPFRACVSCRRLLEGPNQARQIPAGL